MANAKKWPPENLTKYHSKLGLSRGPRRRTLSPLSLSRADAKAGWLCLGLYRQLCSGNGGGNFHF